MTKYNDPKFDTILDGAEAIYARMEATEDYNTKQDIAGEFYEYILEQDDAYEAAEFLTTIYGNSIYAKDSFEKTLHNFYQDIHDAIHEALGNDKARTDAVYAVWDATDINTMFAYLNELTEDNRNASAIEAIDLGTATILANAKDPYATWDTLMTTSNSKFEQGALFALAETWLADAPAEVHDMLAEQGMKALRDAVAEFHYDCGK